MRECCSRSCRELTTGLEQKQPASPVLDSMVVVHIRELYCDCYGPDIT